MTLTYQKVLDILPLDILRRIALTASHRPRFRFYIPDGVTFINRERDLDIGSLIRVNIFRNKRNITAKGRTRAYDSYPTFNQLPAGEKLFISQNSEYRVDFISLMEIMVRNNVVHDDILVGFEKIGSSKGQLCFQSIWKTDAELRSEFCSRQEPMQYFSCKSYASIGDYCLDTGNFRLNGLREQNYQLLVEALSLIRQLTLIRNFDPELFRNKIIELAEMTFNDNHDIIGDIPAMISNARKLLGKRAR